MAKSAHPSQVPSPIVTMSNALTRAAHGLSLAEKRIVMSAVAKLDPRRPHPHGVVLVTKVTAAEYAESFCVDISTAYTELRDGARELYQRSITFFEEAHNRHGKPLAPTRVTMRWIGQAKYHDGEGWIEVHWWPAVVPHLTGLRRQFTQLQLEQASTLRSVYSWKLLELLMRFKGTGWAEYDIEDFAEAMEATEKQRENFAAIRRRMIEPAVAELAAKDGWVIKWEPIKAGRRVKALRFYFEREAQLRLDLEASKPTRPRARSGALGESAPAPAPTDPRRLGPTETELAEFARPGESREQALERWHTRGPAALKAALGLRS
jgi:plasmid replication initiation protein